MQIVTVVGAGEVRSGVGTLASPTGGRWEAAGEQDAGRPKGPHPSSLLVSQNTYPRESPSISMANARGCIVVPPGSHSGNDGCRQIIAPLSLPPSWDALRETWAWGR